MGWKCINIHYIKEWRPSGTVQYEQIQCKEIQKWKEYKWHYKLGEMGNEIFFTHTSSFHSLTDQRRERKLFIDGGNANPFHISLGFGLYRLEMAHTSILWPIWGPLSWKGWSSII